MIINLVLLMTWR